MKIKHISKWDWSSIFWGAILIFGFTIAISYGYERRQVLKGVCRYEIAIHTNTVWAQSFINHFYFNVDNKRYYAGNKGLIENNLEGKPYRYVVRYAVADPTKNEILMEAPVPRYVKSAPPSGWKEYPPSIKWKGAEFDWSYIEKK